MLTRIGLPESTFSLPALEAKLVTYISDPSATVRPFELSSIPKISREQAQTEALRSSIFCSLPAGCANT